MTEVLIAKKKRPEVKSFWKICIDGNMYTRKFIFAIIQLKVRFPPLSSSNIAHALLAGINNVSPSNLSLVHHIVDLLQL